MEKKHKGSAQEAEKSSKKNSASRKSITKPLKRTKSEAYCEYFTKLLHSADDSVESFYFPETSSSNDSSPTKQRNDRRDTFSVSPSRSFLLNVSGTVDQNPKTPMQDKIAVNTKSSVRKSLRKLWDKPSGNDPVELAKKKEIFEFDLLSPKPPIYSEKKEKTKKRVTLYKNGIDLSSPHSSRGSKDSDIIFVGIIPGENNKESKEFIKTPLKRTATFDKDTDTPKSNVNSVKSKKKRRSRSSSCVVLSEIGKEDNFEDISGMSKFKSKDFAMRLRRTSSCVLNKDVSEFLDMTDVPSSTVVDSRFKISSSYTSISSPAHKKKLVITGTPHPKKKANLLIKALASHTSSQNPETKPSSQKSDSKPSSRTKLPNFAKIHQKNFDKMENISEMVKRKAARAEFLLSGSKPDSFLTENASSSRGKNIKKQLEFPYTDRELVEKVRQVSPSNTSKSTLWVCEKLNQKVTFGGGKVFKSKENKDKHVIATPSKNNSKLLMAHKQKTNDNALSPVKSKKELTPFKVSNKPLSPFKINKNVNKDGYTRLGFKLGGAGKVNKENEIKAVAMKTKVMKNNTEQKRNELKGVRLNRRFELLMKMRNGK